ncbi:MAG TPA: FAD-dependent oxidoreductase, partial [SAR86 cluster bacterium]|nr:FAD-dependent oxidoreductase [SAR86 cluster bacterium]
MKEDQIIIIGGGLLGLATANALLDRGEKVLVLERSEETALETSFANAGMLTPSQSAPWNSPPDIARILSGIGRKDSPMTLSVKQIPSLFFWGIKFMFYSRPQSFERISREIFSLANYSKLLTKNIRDSENIRYDESTKGTMKIFRDSERLQQSFDFSNRIYGDSTTKLLNREEVIDLEPQLKEIKDLEGGLHYRSDETGDAYKF